MNPSDVTTLLDGWRRGDRDARAIAAAGLFRAASNRRAATEKRAAGTPAAHGPRPRGIPQARRSAPSGLANQAHFFGVAAQVMRRVLVDHARRRAAVKRGDGTELVSIEQASDIASTDLPVLALDAALDRLEKIDPGLAKLIELRAFSGLNNEQAALILDISPSTVKRELHAGGRLTNELGYGGRRGEASRWQRVKALFEAAIERPPAERAAFVAAAAAEDDDLRREVESLLAADAQAVNFDEPLPDLLSTADVRGEWPTGLDRALAAVGDRIGPYDVLEPLDAGSIGQVYRAHDTKLNRDVALKIVPDVIARDPGHLTQVVREGQLLASLNHPNIAAIYGLEETHGIQILVLELVDGPTLANRMADGSLSLAEALRVASQVAAAGGAHEGNRSSRSQAGQYKAREQRRRQSP